MDVVKKLPLFEVHVAKFANVLRIHFGILRFDQIRAKRDEMVAIFLHYFGLKLMRIAQLFFLQVHFFKMVDKFSNGSDFVTKSRLAGVAFKSEFLRIDRHFLEILKSLSKILTPIWRITVLLELCSSKIVKNWKKMPKCM